MQLTGKRPTFRKSKPFNNPYRVLIWLGLLIGFVFLLRGIENNQVQSPFMPTPVPTRTAQSYAMEAQSYFNTGNVEKAILTYQKSLDLEPQNAALWSELARIQVYSTASLTTDAEQATRLQAALTSIDQAILLAPDDSTAHAIRSFVLDWLANPSLSGEEADSYLTQAEQEAVHALQLDNQNSLALAYYAEILVDQQKWLQAQQYAQQAVDSDPTLMDVHRISAYVEETFSNYGDAINEYKKATEITPNLTFLYIRIGLNYRILKQYEVALEYFQKAAEINAQLGIRDPIPYLAIGKTYTQMGEFFIASRNVEKALQFNPFSPDVYGQLGIVYYKGKNYEGALLALKCAVRGCTTDETCELRECDTAVDPQIAIEGMPLSGTTVVYYYTYGSVLAGLHTPQEEKCAEAVQVLEEVRTEFANDITIMNIVQNSEDICASFGFTP
jgi:tetratricopeptide (TPR) repeat protein